MENTLSQLGELDDAAEKTSFSTFKDWHTLFPSTPPGNSGEIWGTVPPSGPTCSASLGLTNWSQLCKTNSLFHQHLSDEPHVNMWVSLILWIFIHLPSSFNRADISCPKLAAAAVIIDSQKTTQHTEWTGCHWFIHSEKGSKKRNWGIIRNGVIEMTVLKTTLTSTSYLLSESSRKPSFHWSIHLYYLYYLFAASYTRWRVCSCAFFHLAWMKWIIMLRISRYTTRLCI